jgi:hypothetical protein
LLLLLVLRVCQHNTSSALSPHNPQIVHAMFSIRHLHQLTRSNCFAAPLLLSCPPTCSKLFQDDAAVKSGLLQVFVRMKPVLDATETCMQLDQKQLLKATWYETHNRLRGAGVPCAVLAFGETGPNQRRSSLSCYVPQQPSSVRQAQRLMACQSPSRDSTRAACTVH